MPTRALIDIGNALRTFSYQIGLLSQPRTADRTETPLFPATALDIAEMKPAPIPADWIIEGAPEASCQPLSATADGWASTDHWACTAGTFRWHFGWNETVLFLEGDVTITDDKGKVYEGRPGVSLFFPAGTSATWQVHRYVRKIAFNQQPVPRPLHLLNRLTGKVGRLLGIRKAKHQGLG